MDAATVQGLVNIGMFVLAVLGLWQTVVSNFYNQAGQKRTDLEEDYERVKKERDEGLVLIGNLRARVAELEKNLIGERANLLTQIQQANQERVADAERDAARGKLLRLLLVEDNLSDAILILEYLKRAGYAVYSSRVYREADLCAVLVSQVFDAVIMDHKLPGMSALAALDHIRAARPRLPVIVVSRVVEERDGVRLMERGARDFVGKDNLARLAPALERELNTNTENERD